MWDEHIQSLLISRMVALVKQKENRMVYFLEGPAVPGSLRQINRLTVLRLLREFGPVTKPALARHSGLSRPTISKLVDDLESSGLAECVGAAPPSASGGKPGALYRFNADGVRSGAIFLTVDTARIAIVDGNACILGHLACPLGADRRPEPVVALLVTSFQELIATLELSIDHLLGIGIGVPGLTSFQAGIVHFAPHFPQWHEVRLRDMLIAQLPTEVWVDNDCHVQALAERHFGKGQDCTDFVTVESGIGLSAAFYLHNTLYRGKGETAGEVGHMTIQEEGPLCECGNRGCWESLASTTWMVEQFYEAYQDVSTFPGWLEVSEWSFSFQEKLGKLEPRVINAMADAIFRAAQTGQPEAVALVRQHASHFGVGIANIVNALNPQRIIIWGDSVAGGELFLGTVREVVKQRALNRPREMCEIVFSSLIHNTGLLGAASLAINALFNSLPLGQVTEPA